MARIGNGKSNSVLRPLVAVEPTSILRTNIISSITAVHQAASLHARRKLKFDEDAFRSSVRKTASIYYYYNYYYDNNNYYYYYHHNYYYHYRTNQAGTETYKHKVHWPCAHELRSETMEKSLPFRPGPCGFGRSASFTGTSASSSPDQPPYTPFVWERGSKFHIHEYSVYG